MSAPEDPPETTALPRSDSDSGDRDLDGLLAEYLERLESGQSPNPSDYLSRYPQHADELRSFFRNHHWMGDAPAPQAGSLCGQEVGPYRIESEIARGGMGIVYRAQQIGLDRPVAIKVISNGVLASEEERRRFRIEAESAAQLDHPGIISIHEIGTWNGHEYFSMTLVNGPTLQRHVEERSLSEREAAEIVRDVARAVAYAHRFEIVHRDLKPENILIDEEGRPLVADFGLAKWDREGTMLTRTGQVLGTPNYMSPEQASGRIAAGVLSDVYSLGAILYALITGVPPHAGRNPAEVLRSVLQDEPSLPRSYRPELSRELESVCLKAIRFEPEARYGSADQLADDLDRFLHGENIEAASSGLIERVAREIGRDQHKGQFQSWPRTLLLLGWIIFLTHVLIFVLLRNNVSLVLAYWGLRLTMFVFLIATIHRARDGDLSPRSIAERPIWSIWLGYLSALAVVNILLVNADTDQSSLFFPLAAALSGFAFVAMAGHIWGGSALAGIAFFALAPVMYAWEEYAPLMFGTMYLAAIFAISYHYRRVSA